ncbi:DUF998 domain-containing protein [Nannocystis sp. ILAH1]|uniref:DUF998 domain-containing protein n=1 Tax=Nannocystis sp. ILAH1 TaxID=2996789 RepID=UPI002271D5C3|nr:DUF998 domain-containing protein [Nannocystis sp. ILAH1]MCY0993087.1 DUF998 domain-containing protein [Nannocystis sp. ILAH1]
MTEYIDPTATAAVRQRMRHRLAGAVLVAAAMIFLLAEFIAAAAWTDPPYSYTHHYISNLGVRGPLGALGQVMNSPLAWVMNLGFSLFGILVFVGVVALAGLSGWRRWAALILGVLVAVGGLLLATNPGSGELPDGAVDYHGLGAFATIVGGNVLVSLLGWECRQAGIGRRAGRAMVRLGVFGLVSLAAFLSVASSGANVLIGLVERCAVYPILVGLAWAGRSLLRPRTVSRSACGICSPGAERRIP